MVVLEVEERRTSVWQSRAVRRVRLNAILMSAIFIKIIDNESFHYSY